MAAVQISGFSCNGRLHVLFNTYIWWITCHKVWFNRDACFVHEGVDDAGVEDTPYIFHSSNDMESMQLNSLFPEDYEGNEQDNQPRDRRDSASALSL